MKRTNLKSHKYTIEDVCLVLPKAQPPHIITGSIDHTIKVTLCVAVYLLKFVCGVCSSNWIVYVRETCR